MGLTKKKKKLGVYLDGAANTPLDKEVFKAMEPYLEGFCGNSNSTHKYGQVADMAVESARASIAGNLGCRKDEVVFTSGATESNNWVIKGLALAELEKPAEKRRNRILCLTHEHSSVLAPCKSLEALGFEIEYVDPIGDISVFPMFQRALSKKKDPPLLVCCMAVNNETGQIFPAEAVAKYALEIYGTPTLVDCTQGMSVGGEAEIALRKRYPSAAYMSFSGHKLYGPTGIGCLIVNRGIAGGSFAAPHPLLDGGSQECGLRGGTVNVAGVVGLAKAVDLLAHASLSRHFKTLRKYLIGGINAINEWAVLNLFPNSVRNLIFLNKNNGVDHILSVNCGDFVDFPNLADALASRGVAVSAGAACAVSDDGTEPSHVLTALQIDNRGIRNTVRVSFTKYTTKDDIEEFLLTLRSLIVENYMPRGWSSSLKKRQKEKEG